ncbi:hypothetical protein NG821_12195 [Prevotella cerevisiae]|uniref:Uncharacterized protein n=1 Tax=Segatella cerevisiae TaxID=2053716 RepID=A0ABT1BZR9_9BACT|nr:hypothetical protein [Segatella cerevisiae]MCO6026586.1 hypothetical protein [Segatella cerevisiae]
MWPFYLVPLQHMNRCVVLILCLLVGIVAYAQRTCVIADMETHVPIKDVIVHTNTDHWARTDYRGYFAMHYSFDSASVSKIGYLKTYIYNKNLPDTVFLLQQAHQLHEVEVFGNDLGKQNANSIGNSSSQAAKEVVVPKGLANFNAFGWMDRRGNRDRRHQKKAQSVISELDSQQQESSGDPILEAFHQQQAIKAAADKAKLEALEKAREKQAAETDQKKKAAEKEIAN